LFVPKSTWVRVLAGIAEETDYDNFKSKVARHQGEGKQPTSILSTMSGR
jgi:hypothetical protein